MTSFAEYKQNCEKTALKLGKTLGSMTDTDKASVILKLATLLTLGEGRGASRGQALLIIEDTIAETGGYA